MISLIRSLCLLVFVVTVFVVLVAVMLHAPIEFSRY